MLDHQSSQRVAIKVAPELASFGVGDPCQRVAFRRLDDVVAPLAKLRRGRDEQDNGVCGCGIRLQLSLIQFQVDARRQTLNSDPLVGLHLQFRWHGHAEDRSVAREHQRRGRPVREYDALVTMQQQTTQRQGHNWDLVEDVRDYVEKVDQEDRRAEGLKLLTRLVRRGTDEPLRILDVGTGQGLLAALFLDAFPAASAVGLDASEAMRQVAMQRMAAYGDRFEYMLGNFVEGELPADLGEPFDVVVSSRAIHHVPSRDKQLLYAAIYRVLAPAGVFLNLDGARPDDALRDVYTAAGGRPARSHPDSERARETSHYFETLDEQLEFLRTAGFRSVDCFWKSLDLVLIGGYK